MKIELKAYKCTFPKFYIDAYDKNMWQDPKQYQIIYGKTQKEAVIKKCNNDEFYSYWQLKSNINTRRFPEQDLYSQEKSELLKSISINQIHHLTHSLGVEIGEKCPNDFYRNRSIYYKKHEECEKLVKLGLMENWKALDSQVYAVTKKGIKAVKTLLLNLKSKI